MDCICLCEFGNNCKFVHSFSDYKWPIMLLKMMNKDIHNIIWTGSIYVKKCFNVAWHDCCRSLREGDLGVKNLMLFN